MLTRRSLRLLQSFRPHKSREFSTHESCPPVIFNSVCVASFIPEERPEEMEACGFAGSEEERKDRQYRDPNAYQKMNTNIDLLKLMGTSGGAFSFRKPKFPAATVRFRSGRNSIFTMQVFTGAKCPVVGCSSREQVVCTVQQFRLYLRDRGMHVRTGAITMSNVVCSGSVGYPIDIEQFQRFDPIGNVKIHESFPGMMRDEYTKYGDRVQFLIFDSGRYIAMGLSSASDEAAREAFELIEPRLRANRLKGSKPILADESIYKNAKRFYRNAGGVANASEIAGELAGNIRGGGRGRGRGGGRGGRTVGRGRGRAAPAATARKRKRDNSVYTQDAKMDLELLKYLT